MGNGPPLAPILLRNHLRSAGPIDIFDANAFFFSWLLDSSTREKVYTHVSKEILYLLDQSLLMESDLARLGLLMSFRDGAYARNTNMTFDRAGIHWATVDQIMLSASPHPRDKEFGNGLWECALDAVAARILDFKPQHLAFSLLFETQCRAAAGLGQRMRDAGFGGHILLGGAVIKLADDAMIGKLIRQTHGQLAYKFNVYEDLKELGAYLDGTLGVMQIPNVSWLGKTGELGTAKAAEAHHVAKLPARIDCSNLDMQHYQTPRTFPVLLSEGCYWGKCEFCDYPYLASRDPFLVSVLFRDPDAVIGDALSIQSEYGIDSIDLISDAVPFAYFRRLRNAGGEVLRQHGIKMSCSIRAEPKASGDDFENMMASGVDSITIGIESLCDSALAGMQKGNTYNDILRNLTYAREAGLRVKGNFIYDYPRLTEDDLALTVQRLDEIAPLLDGIGIHSFSLSSRAPAAWRTGEIGLRVLGSHTSTDHGGHHLAFERVDDSAALRREQAKLRTRLEELSYSLEACDVPSKTYEISYEWTSSGAVAARDGSRLHLRVPGTCAPFEFYT